MAAKTVEPHLVIQKTHPKQKGAALWSAFWPHYPEQWDSYQGPSHALSRAYGTHLTVDALDENGDVEVVVDDRIMDFRALHRHADIVETIRDEVHSVRELRAFAGRSHFQVHDQVVFVGEDGQPIQIHTVEEVIYEVLPERRISYQLSDENSLRSPKDDRLDESRLPLIMESDVPDKSGLLHPEFNAPIRPTTSQEKHRAKKMNKALRVLEESRGLLLLDGKKEAVSVTTEVVGKGFATQILVFDGDRKLLTQIDSESLFNGQHQLVRRPPSGNRGHERDAAILYAQIKGKK